MDPQSRNQLLTANSGGDNWEIIMAADRKNNNTGSDLKWGYTGTGGWRNITSSNTNASYRVGFGNGSGLYDAFFNKQDITKMAFVSGTGDYKNPTTHTKYIVYELVGSTGSQSLYTLLYNLDSYNRNNSWAGTSGDYMFQSDSATNFVGGYAKSGSSILDSGHYKAKGGASPASFCIWGNNNASDNDTQVLCGYSGNLKSGKGDSWRGVDPQETFWSYWGNDFHYSSSSQTISAGGQTDPGWGASAGNSMSHVNELVYLIAA
tara:strand:- start:1178 stop:1963 length:786 start_codon:yes stop_codon:yes gene_type:complete